MYNINSAGTGYEPTWFAKRYITLLVEFPNDLTPEVLSSFNAYEALKYAHTFLTSLASELNVENIEKVFTKIDLIWGLCIYGEVLEDDNKYCLAFNKGSLKKNKDTLPSNYETAFYNISENGFYTKFYKK